MRNRYDSDVAKQSLKDKLTAIIVLESSKPYKKMDGDLVTECVDFLMELEGKEKLTKEEIKQKIEAIPFKGKVTALGKYAKKKLAAKRIAVIAAVLAVLLALFSVFSIASENAFGDLLSKMGQSLIDLLDNDSLEYEGITIYKADEVRTYPSLEELLETEELEILYPTWLPNDEKITKVMYLLDGGTERYIFQCNISHYSLGIEIGDIVPEDIKNSSLSKIINGFTVYYSLDGKFVQGYFSCKGYIYSIGADTEEDLFKIIKNLKENK